MFHKIISRGPVSGEYQGFPDSCRLHNGDIVATFYAGYGHISLPNEQYPNGGRICLTRSSDEGRTWSEPVTIYDDEYDNRDPHIVHLSNGTVVCSFFSLKRSTNKVGYECIGAQIIRSFDGGATWEEKSQSVLSDGTVWVCSAPVRELPDGTCLLPIYREDEQAIIAGVVRSHDFGATWGEAIQIGKDSGLNLPAETDIILLNDGSLFAALRGDEGENMYYSTSPDSGLSWSEVKDIGFDAHAPHLNRLNSGEILMACRSINPQHNCGKTGLYVSRDECKSWLGPYTVDLVGGAYPSTIELKDGSVLATYYEEGPTSAVRVQRFLLPTDIQLLPLD